MSGPFARPDRPSPGGGSPHPEQGPAAGADSPSAGRRSPRREPESSAGPAAAGGLPLDLGEFIRAQGLDAALVSPGVPMPTVEAAAAALGVPPERIFKSILFQARDGACVMAVACGRARVDVKRLEALTGLAGLRLARPELALRVTGYPAGGTPPVGHRERFPIVVDTRVAAQPWGWAGGGREELMVRIAAADIIRLGDARVADVVEGDPSPA